MSNCPFCGSNKVSKTFNFNEYTCDLCECDYKHTSSGIKIFQEGSWSTFCESITKEVSSKTSSAPVIDLVTKTMLGYSKRNAEEVDLVIESLSSIASTLNSEYKVGLRGKKDFLAVVEAIDTTIRAAHNLHKRQADLGIHIKLSEGILDWFKGENAEEAETASTLGGPSGPYEDNETEMVKNMQDAGIQREGAMSDLDIVAQEVVDTLGEQALEDEAVIAFVQQNYPDDVENINLILQSVQDKMQGGDMEGDGMTDVEADSDTLKSAGMGPDEDYGGSNDMGYDESANQKVIDELVPIYKLEKLDDPNARPDLGVETGDVEPEEDEEDRNEVKLGEEDGAEVPPAEGGEDPFAADAGGEAPPAEGGAEAPAEGGEDPFAADAGGEAPAEGDAGVDAGVDAGGEDPSLEGGEGDAIADVQDAAETVQDKFKRLETKIDDLLSKVETLGGGTPEEAPVEGDAEGDAGGEDPFASEGGEEAPPVEGGDAGGEAPAEGGDAAAAGGEDPFAESVVREAAKRKAKKIGVITTRGKETKASYQRKQSAAEAHEETEEDGEDRTDMKAEVQEEDIPFTEGPKKQMDKDTESDAPGATKKPTGEVACREGFNGFRVGDEVLVEGSTDAWNILGIQKNIFTLGRGKTTTKIDIFKESVRHSDTRLEWQTTEELMRESKNRWQQVANSYTTDKEVKVTGTIGLGGGNRIGGQKFGEKTELSEATKIPVIETLAADRKDVYKYIKDNALHRCAREVAVQRVCEKFTNPVEEITNIVDDAVLSEDAAQVETIDSQYGYKAAPIGEHALRQAFQKGWQSVVESETKVINEVGTPEQHQAISAYLASIGKTPKQISNIMTISSTEDLMDLYDAAVKAKSKMPMEGVGYYRTADDKLIDGIGRTAADRLMGK
jgi:hypothetical protein